MLGRRGLARSVGRDAGSSVPVAWFGSERSRGRAHRFAMGLLGAGLRRGRARGGPPCSRCCHHRDHRRPPVGAPPATVAPPGRRRWLNRSRGSVLRRRFGSSWGPAWSPSSPRLPSTWRSQLGAVRSPAAGALMVLFGAVVAERPPGGQISAIRRPRSHGRPAAALGSLPAGASRWAGRMARRPPARHHRGSSMDLSDQQRCRSACRPAGQDGSHKQPRPCHFRPIVHAGQRGSSPRIRSRLRQLAQRSYRSPRSARSSSSSSCSPRWRRRPSTRRSTSPLIDPTKASPSRLLRRSPRQAGRQQPLDRRRQAFDLYVMLGPRSMRGQSMPKMNAAWRR